MAISGSELLIADLLEKINKECIAYFNKKFDKISSLPLSASARRYYRIYVDKKSYLVAYNSDIRENSAFFYFTKLFYFNKLNVPQLFHTSEDKTIYIIEDLGNETLYSSVVKSNFEPEFILRNYKIALNKLVQFQMLDTDKIDFEKCYPRESFDYQSILWDLNYFKYYFLKLVNVPFDEQLLENDFNALIKIITEIKNDYFMFRDFQSRNIMIKDNELNFIDYQGGRRGPLQYDVASLLFDAKANLTNGTKSYLLEYYLSIAGAYETIDNEKFKSDYYYVALIRLLQAFGAYGYRGYFERKEHFLKSIPYALNNLDFIISKLPKENSITYLIEVIRKMKDSEDVAKFLFKEKKETKLKIQLTSFSYKKGIPEDETENGGGFVFDCRCLYNPGRQEEFKTLCGKDQPVIDFLESDSKVEHFKSNVFAIIDQAVDNYIERGFDHLMINFGCTGGQHRSVYFAEKTKSHLLEKYGITATVTHTNLPQ